MNPRYATVLVAVLILVAGCSDAEFVNTDGSPSDGPDMGNPDVWHPYQFAEGESYTYAVTDGGRSMGTFSWEVLSKEGNGTVTIRTSGTIDGEPFETTGTGTSDQVYGQVLQNPAGGYALIALYSPFLSSFEDERLAVGEGWEYHSGTDTVSYKVERKDTIAGREVFVTVARENGVPVYETWVDPELSLAAKTVTYDQGQVETEVALTAYTR